VSNWPSEKKIFDEQFDVVFTVCKKYHPWSVREHFYQPLTDGKKVPDNLQSVVSFIHQQWLFGKKILVHCYLGRNRSYLAAIEVYAKVTNMSKAEALEEVRAIYSGAITNPVFEEYLKS